MLIIQHKCQDTSNTHYTKKEHQLLYIISQIYIFKKYKFQVKFSRLSHYYYKAECSSRPCRYRNIWGIEINVSFSVLVHNLAIIKRLSSSLES